ncbi:MAG: hypothetical protein A2402_01440 [Candidatus Staskawiczbacteria bacterium RIFOXYC1_FULL_37_43]|nr:MAG: hypothetical protein A2813_00170 [Candidatus Staskawiczbacteria bacterium RIFCSPHIGHO2_01_FULL_37_17]OGZ71980.1 MAG: hypothetical protein A2891_03485 [Candidatus Staskawiczbacteria bacterium RIFCSPLOWO2_01_FULL_37_19]OGZ75519.1 MAG: hypothetical protein A2205_01955 [Candidatus Staskawiczbacteria bacterium RIFOXYA1_FULL_37_15]OGZ77889.1 MAG: hypothetical protein A2280_03890 [Candidatus Staskawiczbacteria bacterium RIFOXYA12_FULL_37_10]OGZ80507.1 MAG: hypothetical protein A2353_03220 [Can
MKRGVNIIITNNQGKILILRRSPKEKFFPGLWDLPGGKVENGETLGEAAERETKEESGLAISLEQKYFYIFHCQDRELNIYGFKARSTFGDISLSNEHSDFKWIFKDEYKSFEYTPSVKTTIEEFFFKK